MGVLAACGTIFGGDVDMDRFVLFSDEGMLEFGVDIKEGLDCCG